MHNGACFAGVASCRVGRNMANAFGTGANDETPDFAKKNNHTAKIVGALAVAGAAGFGALALKGESDKPSVAQGIETLKQVRELPADKAQSRWRELALTAASGPRVRMEALQEIGWSKDAAGISAVIAALSDTDHRVRGTAAQAVFDLGPAAQSAVPALQKALLEADQGDKPLIAWALATLGDKSSWDAIFAEYKLGHLTGIQHSDGASAFDSEVLVGLTTLEKLAALKSDENAGVRQLVATTLSRAAKPEFATALIELVKDKDIEVAREAAVGLGRLGRDDATAALLDALARADQDTRPKFLEALRDGDGARGLVLALRAVSPAEPQRYKVRSQVILDMLKAIGDPRVGDALVPYVASEPKPHFKTEAAFRMAEVGDLRALPLLAWRMEQNPETLYTQTDDPEHRRNDDERVVAARMISDLAMVHPEAQAQILAATEKSVLEWVTKKPEPIASGLRALVTAGSTQIVPKLRAWSSPKSVLPESGTQNIPSDWSVSRTALRYLGWSKDAQSWGVLEKAVSMRPSKDYDLSMQGLAGAGITTLALSITGAVEGGADGMAQWSDPRGFASLLKVIENPRQNEAARSGAARALGWCATEADLFSIAQKAAGLAKASGADGITRSLYLRALVERPVGRAGDVLVGLLRSDVDLEVRRQVGRVLGLPGLSPELSLKLKALLKDKAVRTDAAMALILGGTESDAREAVLAYNDGPDGLEELKLAYAGAFLGWTELSYQRGDLGRWVRNAEAVRRVRIGEVLQDWPRAVVMDALSGDFDKGPHSINRNQLRVRLYNDARSTDAAKSLDAIRVLAFMREKGSLLALRSTSGAWQAAAGEAYMGVLNPSVAQSAAPKVQDPSKPTH